jgi:hypothetical protein
MCDRNQSLKEATFYQTVSTVDEHIITDDTNTVLPNYDFY